MVLEDIVDVFIKGQFLDLELMIVFLVVEVKIQIIFDNNIVFILFIYLVINMDKFFIYYFCLYCLSFQYSI